MEVQKQVFVFVVCGAAEHIHTLHYSLAALQKFSEKEIVVVTDSSRNETPVVHTSVVDVSTPEKFNHHQASIFLKTGLHKFLPTGNLYCYLDTDVVAIDSTADKVFMQYSAPVTFAKDHCCMAQFSPFAMNCECKKVFDSDLEKYLELERSTVKEMRQEYNAIQQHLNNLTAYNKRNIFARLYHTVRYYLSGRYYRLDAQFRWDKMRQLWLNAQNEYIEEKYGYHKLFKEQMNLDWSWEHRTFYTSEGKPFFDLSCSHLKEEIERVFGINITNKNWQHWNGGVFLFDDSSHDFLEFWHNATMKIFELPEWKTRDQGTLIAIVWKLGLQNHPLLDSHFNYIVDYTNHKQQYEGNLTFTDQHHKHIKPYFLHVFHHFGDAGWKMWNDIEKHLSVTYLEN